MPRLIGSITGRERGRSDESPALACAAGSAFWVPAASAAHGWFPAPLDDVYIHFDFARSLASGHPFEWIPGQGYSSGETSPLYAVVLAIGWLLGFHGRALGVWAAIVAIASVASLISSVRRLLRGTTPWLSWLLALFPLSIGVVDWALFSGMEVAVFVAALGRALETLAALRASPRGGPTRERRQWQLGAWGAALMLLRPEAGVIVAVLAVAAARGAGRRSGVAALARTALPAALATAAVLGANLAATGDARSAGAQLKLLSSNPFLSDVDRARVFVENLVTFWMRVVRHELAISPAVAWTLPTLAALGLLRREHRAVAGAAIVAAIGWTLLASWNGNSPYHNFRYYAPALVLLAIAAALGVASIASALRSRRGAIVGTLLAVLALTVGGLRVPAQIVHFRAATANIRDQQIEVGERLARLPADARILVGDAGAIPYVSGHGAVDAMGLGGYRGVPFAHAAVYGEAATIELIERLDPSDRPTHLALYPNWFGALTSRFGVELDRVTIEGNVICAGSTKVISRADWSSLDPRANAQGASAAIVDELDVADVIDEAEHAYAAPLPQGGWTTLDILVDDAGTRRFDGGRKIPDGKSESFVVKRSANGPLTLRVRVDGGARGIVLRTARSTKPLVLERAHDGAWRNATTSLERVEAGEVLTLEANGSEYRDYHVWIERTGAIAR